MIGQFIQELIDRGHTQNQIAKLLNRTQPHISDLLKNKKDPSIKLLCKIADTFKTTTDHILGR